VVILLTGLSGAGKSTLALACRAERVISFILDGDEVREGLCSDLGFSMEDRSENLRRVIHCARLIAMNHVDVFVPVIAPYKKDRAWARHICKDVGFIEVFVDCPLETCEKRDPKGLYKKVRLGEISNFTGVDDPFEAPLRPDVYLDTSEMSVEACVKLILVAL